MHVKEIKTYIKQTWLILSLFIWYRILELEIKEHKNSFPCFDIMKTKIIVGMAIASKFLICLCCKSASAEREQWTGFTCSYFSRKTKYWDLKITFMRSEISLVSWLASQLIDMSFVMSSIYRLDELYLSWHCYSNE